MVTLSRNIISRIVLGLILVTGVMHAQDDALKRAGILYRAKQLDQAKLCIDSAIRHPQTQLDYITWTTRAYIYEALAKRSDKYKLNSDLRDTAISSLRISGTLNPDTININNNKRLYRSISIGYYNIAKTILQDSLNYDRSIISYNLFKKYFNHFDSTETFKSYDIQYYLAAGSFFSDLFIKNNDNVKAGEIARVSLMKVLDLQPDHPKALTNLGLMYYNQAATMTQKMDGGEDISQIDIIQDNIVKLAKQAESLIVKVYNNNPQDQVAMRALYYIYRMLYEIDKSNEFKAKLKESGIDIEKEDKENEGKNKQSEQPK